MVKRKEFRTYWSEELIKACESVMNSEQYKEGYDWMTIEEFRDEVRQLTMDGKEKELENLRKEKLQEVNRNFEAIKEEFERWNHENTDTD